MDSTDEDVVVLPDSSEIPTDGNTQQAIPPLTEDTAPDEIPQTSETVDNEEYMNIPSSDNTSAMNNIPTEDNIDDEKQLQPSTNEELIIVVTEDDSKRTTQLPEKIDDSEQHTPILITADNSQDEHETSHEDESDIQIIDNNTSNEVITDFIEEDEDNDPTHVKKESLQDQMLSFFAGGKTNMNGMNEQTVEQQADGQPTDVQPTDVQPTDVQQTDVQQTDVQQTDVQPADVQQTDEVENVGNGINGTHADTELANINQTINEAEDINSHTRSETFVLNEEVHDVMIGDGGSTFYEDNMSNVQQTVLKVRDSIASLEQTTTAYSPKSSDESQHVTADTDFLAMSRELAAREKVLKQQIFHLEANLDDCEQLNHELNLEMDRLHQTSEEKIKCINEEHEEMVDNMKQSFQALEEKLHNDNKRLAHDFEILRDAVGEREQQIDDLKQENKDLKQHLETKKFEWQAHSQQCPLLNEEIAQRKEDERADISDRMERGSQQIESYKIQLLKENAESQETIGELEAIQKSQEKQILQLNIQFEKIKTENEEIKKKYNKFEGSLDEAHNTLAQERSQRIELEQRYQSLMNDFLALGDYSQELAQLFSQAEMKPKGTNMKQYEFQKLREKIIERTSLAIDDRNAAGGLSERNLAQSIGSLQNFVSHMKSVSQLSEVMRDLISKDEAAFVYSSSEHKDTESECTTVVSSTDIGSILSNFTRYSFANYHTHDALIEYFHLTTLSVKLTLAAKYSVSPDIAPDNQSLLQRAISNNIKFHEYYEFLYNELSNLFSFKYKSNQGRICNTVVTNPRKVRQLLDHRRNVKKMKEEYDKQTYIGIMYDSYTRGTESTTNQYLQCQNRTVFNTNDDLFGGHVNVISRVEREERAVLLQSNSRRHSRRSSRHSSKSTHSYRHRNGRRRHKNKVEEYSEPGHNMKHHPLNDGMERRDRGGSNNSGGSYDEYASEHSHRNSLKLMSESSPIKGDSLKSHLSAKSLEMLDPEAMDLILS